MTLDNMEAYPVMKANDDLAALIFTLADGNGTEYVVSGNATASGNTVAVNNPFIHTQAEALTAARLILSTYGGNQLEAVGRGNPASELGDNLSTPDFTFQYPALSEPIRSIMFSSFN